MKIEQYFSYRGDKKITATDSGELRFAEQLKDGDLIFRERSVYEKGKWWTELELTGVIQFGRYEGK